MGAVALNSVIYGSNATENASVVALTEKAIYDIKKEKITETYLTKSRMNADIDLRKNAYYHNSIFVDKDITDRYNDGSMYSAIVNGSFDGLFVGNYFRVTIDNIEYKFRIAGFDWYMNAYTSENGSSKLTQHHVVIVPDSSLMTAKMNDTNVTTGGYMGSKMKTTTIPSLDTKLSAIFGTHLIAIYERFSSSVDNGIAAFGHGLENGASNSSQMSSSKSDLMSEVELYGSLIFSSSWIDGYGALQFPLFALAPEFINANGQGFWLRSVSGSTYFAGVNSRGAASYGGAGLSGGVRPRWIIG